MTPSMPRVVGVISAESVECAASGRVAAATRSPISSVYPRDSAVERVTRSGAGVRSCDAAQVLPVEVESERSAFQSAADRRETIGE